MQALRMIFWLGVFSLFVLFMMQNKWMLQEESYLEFSFYEYHTEAIPVPMVIAATTLIGALLVSISTLLNHLRQRIQIKKHLKRIKNLETELLELKDQSLGISFAADSADKSMKVSADDFSQNQSARETGTSEAYDPIAAELDALIESNGRKS